MDNSVQGTLSSKDGTLQVVLTDALDNHDAGALVSQGKQHVSAASLNNNQGIISGQDDLTLSIAGGLDNSNDGLISSARDLDFNHVRTELSNRNGKVNAQGLSSV